MEFDFFVLGSEIYVVLKTRNHPSNSTCSTDDPCRRARPERSVGHGSIFRSPNLIGLIASHTQTRSDRPVDNPKFVYEFIFLLFTTCFLRASALKNDTLSYFTITKSYFINYTILFYNTPYIQKLYYFTFSLKYYFFNLSLLFLSHHHFFSTKRWNKKYIYF